MAISIKTPKDIEGLRVANHIVALTLDGVEKLVKPGVSLLELDEFCEKSILEHGAKPAFKGLYGFPNTACVSVNEVVIHGIPNSYKLKEGDIVTIDIGSKINGYFGDSARTFGVGKISEQDEKLIACSKDALYFGIERVKAGMHFKELSHAIEGFIRERGFVPLLGFCGHGIGRSPHEEPEIPNYLEGPNPKSGPKIRNGMVFCIEPMICQKDGTPSVDKDKWTTRSVDGLNTAHYEHCVAVINGKAEILSK